MPPHRLKVFGVKNVLYKMHLKRVNKDDFLARCRPLQLSNYVTKTKEVNVSKDKGCKGSKSVDNDLISLSDWLAVIIPCISCALCLVMIVVRHSSLCIPIKDGQSSLHGSVGWTFLLAFLWSHSPWPLAVKLASPTSTSPSIPLGLACSWTFDSKFQHKSKPYLALLPRATTGARFFVPFFYGLCCCLWTSFAGQVLFLGNVTHPSRLMKGVGIMMWASDGARGVNGARTRVRALHWLLGSYHLPQRNFWIWADIVDASSWRRIGQLETCDSKPSLSTFGALYLTFAIKGFGKDPISTH